MHITHIALEAPLRAMVPGNAPRVAATGYRHAWCDEHRKHILSLSGAPFGGCWDCARAAGRSEARQ